MRSQEGLLRKDSATARGLLWWRCSCYLNARKESKSQTPETQLMQKQIPAPISWMAATCCPQHWCKDHPRHLGHATSPLPSKDGKQAKESGKLKEAMCPAPGPSAPTPYPVICTQASPGLGAGVWSELLGVLPKQDLQNPRQGLGAHSRRHCSGKTIQHGYPELEASDHVPMLSRDWSSGNR